MASTADPITRYTAIDRISDGLADLRSRLVSPPKVDTLMHVTHAKAGSSWVSDLLARLFGSRCAPRGPFVAADGDLSRHVFQPGRVYRAMFLSREDFMAHPELREIKRFVVLRDLRDTMISNYFSAKVSHAIDKRIPNMDQLLARREILRGLSQEEGLLYLMENVTPRTAMLQRSWLDQGEIVLRYEEMVLNPCAFFRTLFLDTLQMPVSPATIDRAVRRTHFQTVYGRKLGEEKVDSHGRNGLPGDWRNHFTPELRKKFGEAFGDLLVKTGHEPDDRWILET